MPRSSVTFYGIKSDFFPVAYKLIEKAYAQYEKILFLCDNDEEVKFYNSKLWTSVQLSFIPSGNKSNLPIEDAKFCYVWFSTEISFLNNPTCLLHNGLDIPNMSNADIISQFQKIIDIFDINSIQSTRIRAKFYEDGGFLEQKLWLQSESSWEQGNLS